MTPPPSSHPVEPAHRHRRRRGPLISAILVAGAIAVAGLGALVLSSSGPPDSTTAGGSPWSTIARPEKTIPNPPSATTDQTEIDAIRSSLQGFIDAFNSRDITRIRTSVCSIFRADVSSPPVDEGNVVLEELDSVSVTGDFAQTEVITHLESGTQRSLSKRNERSFVRESGRWYYCPGSRPNMGT